MNTKTIIMAMIMITSSVELDLILDRVVRKPIITNSGLNIKPMFVFVPLLPFLARFELIFWVKQLGFQGKSRDYFIRIGNIFLGEKNLA